MLVSELMTEDPITVTPSMDGRRIHQLMVDQDIRHVPVVDDEEQVVGLVSQRDLMQKTDASLGGMPLSARNIELEQVTAEEIMTKTPESATPDEDVRSAGQTMVENKYGCLPVVVGGRLVGILTETDFVRLVVDQG